MYRIITRALSAALLLGTAAITTSTLTSTTPAYAAAAGGAIKLPAENKALADAVNAALTAARQMRWAEALAKAKEADAMPGKPAELTRALHGLIVSYAISAKDFPAALAQIDKNIAANEGNKTENLKQALSVANMMGDKAKVQQYASALGGNLDNDTRLFIANQMAAAGQNKEALAYAQPALEGNPTEAALKFKQNLLFKMGDANGRRAALEQLVGAYPKPEYWHDLLQLARNEKGLTDEQTMDIYRLRLALGDLKTDSEYTEAAQEALVANYPAEAKIIIDKGTMAKVMQPNERLTRLNKMVGDRVAADTANQADLQKKSAADPNAGIKLGLIYYTLGKGKESEDAIRQAMKGKLADPEGAKIALGHALLLQGKKAEAVQAFDSVTRNSKSAPIARLWSIYARKG